MKSVSNDARGFVDGVVAHLKLGGKAHSVNPKVQSLLLKMSAAAKQEHQAVVESPVKLTPDEVQTIARILSRLSGHEVSLNAQVSPSLIGGIKVTMADWVMDLTLTNELSKMAAIAEPARV